MTVLIAPDSFKGSLSAIRAAGIIREAILATDPAVRCIVLPQADGGEGTLDAVFAARGGTMMHAVVPDLAGRPAAVRWLLNDDGGALLEAAECIGWSLPAGVTRDPEQFLSTGLGMLIRHVAERGGDISVALGGSATTDCGLGLAEALGAVIDSDIPISARVSERLAGVRRITSVKSLTTGLTALADVRNPLTGKQGAVYTYGPQKGLAPERLAAFDAAVAHFAEIVRRDVRDVDPLEPGMGAAGGLGFTLAAFCAAELRSGAEAVRNMTDFDRHLAECDLVITGEGKIDAQTLQGKVVHGIAEAAARKGVPVLAFAGALEDVGADPTGWLSGARLRCITPAGTTHRCAMEEAGAFLYEAVRDTWRRHAG